MTSAPDFLDTNVLIYAFIDDPRSRFAETLLAGGFASSVQVFNEFANVARRKIGMSWNEVRAALALIEERVELLAPIDIDIHRHGLQLAERHGFSLYDAMMLSAALKLGCRIFWSEDLQDGLVVAGTMTIRNPFPEPSQTA